jgi:hypothetical protein
MYKEISSTQDKDELLDKVVPNLNLTFWCADPSAG